MNFLRRYSGEVNAALFCLLILAVGFLYECRQRPVPMPVAAVPSVDLLRAVEVANSFRPLPVSVITSQFSLDAIEQSKSITTVAGDKPVVVRVRRNEPIVLVGWAVDSKAKAIAAGVYVTVDGTHRFAALYGNSRPDVAANVGIANAVASGFAAAIPESTLALGRHSISIDIVNAASSAVYREPTVVTLNVAR